MTNKSAMLCRVVKGKTFTSSTYVIENNSIIIIIMPGRRDIPYHIIIIMHICTVHLSLLVNRKSLSFSV